VIGKLAEAFDRRDEERVADGGDVRRVAGADDERRGVEERPVRRHASREHVLHGGRRSEVPHDQVERAVPRDGGRRNRRPRGDDERLRIERIPEGVDALREDLGGAAERRAEDDDARSRPERRARRGLRGRGQRPRRARGRRSVGRDERAVDVGAVGRDARVGPSEMEPAARDARDRDVGLVRGDAAVDEEPARIEHRARRRHARGAHAEGRPCDEPRRPVPRDLRQRPVRRRAGNGDAGRAVELRARERHARTAHLAVVLLPRRVVRRAVRSQLDARVCLRRRDEIERRRVEGRERRREAPRADVPARRGGVVVVREEILAARRRKRGIEQQRIAAGDQRRAGRVQDGPRAGHPEAADLDDARGARSFRRHEELGAVRGHRFEIGGLQGVVRQHERRLIEDDAVRVDARGAQPRVRETGDGRVARPDDEPHGTVPCDDRMRLLAGRDVERQRDRVERLPRGVDAQREDVGAVGDAGQVRAGAVVLPSDERRAGAPAGGGFELGGVRRPGTEAAGQGRERQDRVGLGRRGGGDHRARKGETTRAVHRRLRHRPARRATGVAGERRTSRGVGLRSGRSEGSLATGAPRRRRAFCREFVGRPALAAQVLRIRRANGAPTARPRRSADPRRRLPNSGSPWVRDFFIGLRSGAQGP
jgi:hypothetical protein